MKKILLIIGLVLGVCSASYAGDGDDHITANVGIMAPYTLDATVGYEFPMGTDGQFEIYGEAGNHWQTPVCHRFWKGWFWDGGALYKHKITHLKNGSLKALGGVQTGMTRQKYFLGCELGFEYEYIFANNWVLSVRQKNTVNFFNGDKFRSGVMVGIKIPLK